MTTIHYKQDAGSFVDIDLTTETDEDLADLHEELSTDLARFREQIDLSEQAAVDLGEPLDRDWLQRAKKGRRIAAQQLQAVINEQRKRRGEEPSKLAAMPREALERKVAQCDQYANLQKELRRQSEGWLRTALRTLLASDPAAARALLAEVRAACPELADWIERETEAA
jgi:septum formation topological specificity factor MinE